MRPVRKEELKIEDKGLATKDIDSCAIQGSTSSTLQLWDALREPED